MGITYLVLDVMKPHQPNLIDVAQALSNLENVSGLNIIMLEVDKEVENIELHLYGNDLDFTIIKQEINDLGGAIHSIDQVIAGDVPEPMSKSYGPQ